MINQAQNQPKQKNALDPSEEGSESEDNGKAQETPARRVVRVMSENSDNVIKVQPNRSAKDLQEMSQGQ